MENSAKRLEMPVFPKEKFIDAVIQTVRANQAFVPPYGSGATLYIRPYMFGINPVIGVKPATDYQFRVLTTPVGPYFKGGDTAINQAIMKASNKIASVINQKCKNLLTFQPLGTPFPEVKSRK